MVVLIYVYTVIADGWDNLRPPSVEIEDGVRYVCFTNIPCLPSVYPWEFRPLYLAPRASRIPKILPHLMLPRAEYSIYHDGNFRLRVSPISMVETLLNDHDWAVHKHPCRNCIYAEGGILIREKIGTPHLVEEELAHYRKQSYPHEYGLWANGMIVRRHSPEVTALNELWWKLYSTGCERDQISFPVARHRLDFNVNTIDADIYSSPYMIRDWHAAWKHRGDNPDYFDQRETVRGKMQRLAEVVGEVGSVKYPEY